MAQNGSVPQKTTLKDETLLYNEDGASRNVQKSFRARCSSLITLRTFVLVSGVLMCAQTALSIYTKSVLTSIERRFQISSSLAGLIIGSFNFGNMMFVVLVSKLSSSGHRPRIMAAGSMVIAVGGFFNVIPHLASSNYKPLQTTNISAVVAESAINSTDISPSSTEQCTSSDLYVLLIIGEMLQGIGATVLVPLGSSYVDDFAESGNSPLYLGIMFLLQNLGPGVGYLVGSLTNMLYVDFDRVPEGTIHLKMTDDSWVGAWWLGYIIIGACVMFSAIPLFWFPRRLQDESTAGLKTIRGMKKLCDSRDNCADATDARRGESHSDEAEAPKLPPKLVKLRSSRARKIVAIFTDLYVTVKRLLTDPIYMLVVMGYSGLMFVVGALTAFMPKFLEVTFYQSKSQASMIFGLSMPVVICIGLFSGGFIVQRSKWKINGTMRFLFAAAGVTVFLCIPTYYVTCDPKPIAPCLNGTGYGNESHCEDTRGEQCRSQCYLFVALMSLAALLCCHIVTPSYSVILRTVNPKDKCTAIGLKFLIIRLVAFIPSPLITGATIDRTCLKWSKSADCVGTSTCLLHDREAFRYSYLHIISFGLVATCLFNLAGCIVQRRKHLRDKRDAQELPMPMDKDPKALC